MRKHHPGSCCLQKTPPAKAAVARGDTLGSRDTSQPRFWGQQSPCRAGKRLPARAPTICPTQMLAASIMAPSAMDRADSFSRWGFPESSSSTTCKAQGQAGPGGGVGQEGAPLTFLYSCSVIFPSRSESYMWNRTARDRGVAGSGQPLPTSPKAQARGQPHISASPS